MRAFELIDGLDERQKEQVTLPYRKTEHSAGYDFFAMEDVVVPPAKDAFGNYADSYAVVHTGIKVKMMPDEFLALYNRSSNALKRGLILSTGVGVVDADYYESNGEVMFMFHNIANEPYTIHKGDAIGQGIFTKFQTVTDEQPVTQKRTGGWGSTGN